MCGIVGYIGNSSAKPVLLNALSTLEYRGYDSCGIAVKNGSIAIHKDTVRVEVMQLTSPALDGTVGIGHTRWATHGEPSSINSHPHTDCTGKFAVVHNGIVSNFQKLRQQLTKEGHVFSSETDSEVIPHMIEKYYQGDIEEAVRAALDEIEGSYAIAVLTADENKLVAARKDSPLIIGVGDGEMFLASDVPAILDYTDRVIYLEDNDVVSVTKNAVRITQDGVDIDREEHRVLWNKEDVQIAGYDHYMIKEIHEQPRVIRDTIGDFLLSSDAAKDSGIEIGDDLSTLSIVACGTSYHAGLIGKYVIEELHGIPVRIDIASEFNHGRRTIRPSVAIAISQSGETADVLSALKRLREESVKTVAITNVPGSTISRVTDQAIYTKAGPEVSVAATKSYIAQLIALYQLALSLPGMNRGIKRSLISQLKQMPGKVEQILDGTCGIVSCAKFLSKHENVFFIGRGINYPIALEGALKLKEISYIHAEGYAAGELKHGSIALLQENTPVIAIVANDNTYDAMISNIKQAKARNAPVIAVASEDNEDIQAMVDYVIRVPRTGNMFSPVINAVALQLLAYHTAKFRECPIDFPRNLAKSVTVE
ncbi:MAG: glutamine--fructose-6-phosphate transaminase (isomerizing) [Chloroflexi bacterium]|jgi:glutamine---fructose-6-phosphate transaminase (isomerizing)|nr:glutamine--fructose-6-phosphate transaminase (isomerizing) [Chloroflexota bacterium]